MVRKFIAAAAVCVLLTVTSCKLAPVAVDPPFWEVSGGESGGRVYMLGSMHVGVNAEYPEEIMSAFEESDIIACEVDTAALSRDTERLSAAMSLMKCPEGTTAADCFGDAYSDIRDFCVKKGIYNSAYEEYLPTVWSSLITGKMARDAGYSTEYSTETYFLTLAKERGKRIYEIESAEFQYAMNAAQPMALQIYNVENAVSGDYGESLRDIQELYRAWSCSDSAALESLCADEDIPEELSEEYAEYYSAMYTERQQVMADYVAESLKNGDKVFMLVGALHFYAEPDILTLLEEAGIEVGSVGQHTMNS